MRWNQLRSYITHIPAHNPAGATLCGTNCFLLGRGKTRVLVESGDDDRCNKLWLENVGAYLREYGVNLSHILITHAHHDHLGGLHDLLKILPHPPLCYKMLTGNQYE